MANPDEDLYFTYDYDDGRAGRYRTSERWYECERCGFVFPESETVIEPQTGRRVCTVKPRCLDPEADTPYTGGFFFRS